MPHAEMDLETPVSVEQVRAALLDFTERRPDIWPGIARSLYKVFEVGETHAEIQEGTKLPLGSFWARERYDWSKPDRIRWTVMESNFSTAGSYVEAILTPTASGGTHLHVVWDREGTSLLGKLVVRLIAATKGKPVADSLKRGLAGLEA